MAKKKKAARKQEEAKSRENAEHTEYARQLLRAHFAEDRNEFLTGEAIRIIGGERPTPIANTKPKQPEKETA